MAATLPRLAGRLAGRLAPIFFCATCRFSGEGGRRGGRGGWGGAIEQPAEARPPRSGLLPPLLPPSPLEEWRVCVMVCVCVCECELPLLSSSRPVVVCCAGWGLFGRVPALLSSCLFAFAVLSWSPRRSLCTVACTPTMLQALSGGMVAVLLSHHDPVSIWSDWSLPSPSLSLGSLDVAIACLTISW